MALRLMMLLLVFLADIVDVAFVVGSMVQVGLRLDDLFLVTCPHLLLLLESLLGHRLHVGRVVLSLILREEASLVPLLLFITAAGQVTLFVVLRGREASGVLTLADRAALVDGRRLLRRGSSFGGPSVRAHLTVRLSRTVASVVWLNHVVHRSNQTVLAILLLILVDVLRLHDSHAHAEHAQASHV